MKEYILSKLKVRRQWSNLYSLKAVEQAVELWEDGPSLMFSYEDHGVKRLAFSVESPHKLDALLNQPKGIYYFDYLTKAPEEYTPKAALAARMLRLVNMDCRNTLCNGEVARYRNDGLAESACRQDAQEINRILWSVFQTEISHLLTDDEMEDKIEAGQITVHRSDRIDAILQVEVQPRRFYINQIVNLGEKGNIHALLLERLGRYIDQGGKYIYAWVEENNVASIKFHGKYGMKHDGMWNLVWRLDR